MSMIWAEKLKIVNVEWFRNMLKICLRAWLVESRISHNRRRDMWGLRNVIPDGYWMSGLSLHWCHHRVSAVTSYWSVGSCIRLLFAVTESSCEILSRYDVLWQMTNVKETLALPWLLQNIYRSRLPRGTWHITLWYALCLRPLGGAKIDQSREKLCGNLTSLAIFEDFARQWIAE